MLLDECFPFCDPPARPPSVIQHAHDHEQSPCLRVASTVSFAVVSVSPAGGFGLLLRYAHAVCCVGHSPRAGVLITISLHEASATKVRPGAPQGSNCGDWRRRERPCARVEALRLTSGPVEL